jgi:hypothetical protein
MPRAAAVSHEKLSSDILRRFDTHILLQLDRTVTGVESLIQEPTLRGLTSSAWNGVKKLFAFVSDQVHKQLNGHPPDEKQINTRHATKMPTKIQSTDPKTEKTQKNSNEQNGEALEKMLQEISRKLKPEPLPDQKKDTLSPDKIKSTEEPEQTITKPQPENNQKNSAQETDLDELAQQIIALFGGSNKTTNDSDRFFTLLETGCAQNRENILYNFYNDIKLVRLTERTFDANVKQLSNKIQTIDPPTVQNFLEQCNIFVNEFTSEIEKIRGLDGKTLQEIREEYPKFDRENINWPFQIYRNGDSPWIVFRIFKKQDYDNTKKFVLSDLGKDWLDLLEQTISGSDAYQGLRAQFEKVAKLASSYIENYPQALKGVANNPANQFLYQNASCVVSQAILATMRTHVFTAERD